MTDPGGVRRLTPGEWESLAKPVFDSLFRPEVTEVFRCHEPFEDALPKRLLIDCGDGFHMLEPQYGALCRAANALGDQSMFCSVLHSYHIENVASYHTWEVPISDYETYLHADDVPFTLDAARLMPKNVDLGIPLVHVLYSPHATWAVYLPELYGVLAGSAGFIGKFKQEFPGWPKDLDSFLGRFEEAARERGVRVSWVPVLLRHVYGDEAPRFVVGN